MRLSSALGMLLIMAGCTRKPVQYAAECETPEPAVDLPAERRDSIVHPQSSYDEGDIRSARIARQFPGYAGWFHRWTSSGESWHQLWFTDTARGRQILDTIVRLEKIVSRDSIPYRLTPVRWDYAQLYDWYYYLQPRLMRMDKVYKAYIDPHVNRITFHVADTVVGRELDSQLVAMRVPCGLVKVVLGR